MVLSVPRIAVAWTCD
jgi:hypothetical protein